jgi:hypothetical protein
MDRWALRRGTRAPMALWAIAAHALGAWARTSLRVSHRTICGRRRRIRSTWRYLLRARRFLIGTDRPMRPLRCYI